MKILLVILLLISVKIRHLIQRFMKFPYRRGSGDAIEAIFPEEGTYFGNDHDLGHLLSGAGFIVQATRNSTTEGDTNGT